jgi:hypothetical protein
MYGLYVSVFVGVRISRACCIILNETCEFKQMCTCVSLYVYVFVCVCVCKEGRRREFASTSTKRLRSARTSSFALSLAGPSGSVRNRLEFSVPVEPLIRWM